MSIDVILEDARWTALQSAVTRAADATLAHLSLDPGKWDVTVLACNDARIVDLNGDFRNKRQPTNVLSWPSAERGAGVEGERPGPPKGDPELGDIAISYETCEKEAQTAAIPLENHAIHLVVHGVLHLLGYDHVLDGDADLMEATETAILAKLGIANPYTRG